MPPQRLEKQVEILEQKVSDLEQLPARVAELGSQIARLRGEMHAEFSALRGEAAESVTLGQLNANLGQLRDEVRAIRGNGADLTLAKLQVEMRSEFAAIRGNGADLSLAKLHEEIAAIRGEGGESLTLVALRQEIRDGDEETRRLMRVLHEDLVQRIALLGEARASGETPPRSARSRKKSKKTDSRRG